MGGGPGGSPFSGFQGFPGFGGAPAGFDAGAFNDMAPAPDLEAELGLPLTDAFTGTNRRMTLQGPDGPMELTVKIPAGVKDGARLRLAGKGGAGPRGQRGDLFLNIRLDAEPPFRFENGDLLVEVPVPFTTVALGGTIEVATLEGEKRQVKVKAGCDSNAKLRIRGQGYGSVSDRGDLFVAMIPIVPRTLTAKQKELLEALKNEGL